MGIKNGHNIRLINKSSKQEEIINIAKKRIKLNQINLDPQDILDNLELLQSEGYSNRILKHSIINDEDNTIFNNIIQKSDEDIDYISDELEYINSHPNEYKNVISPYLGDTPEEIKIRRSKLNFIALNYVVMIKIYSNTISIECKDLAQKATPLIDYAFYYDKKDGREVHMTLPKGLGSYRSEIMEMIFRIISEPRMGFKRMLDIFLVKNQ